MTKLSIPLVLTIAIVFISCSKTKHPLSENLIQNAGAEQPINEGQIPHWIKASGENWTYRDTEPSPHGGTHYFFAGRGAKAELQQDVDVSQYASGIDAHSRQFVFSGYVRSYGQSSADDGEIIVEFINDGKEILDSYDSKRQTNPKSWKKVMDQRMAPKGTRRIRIRLMSWRNAGSNNDGYFDDLSLKTRQVDSEKPIVADDY